MKLIERIKKFSPRDAIVQNRLKSDLITLNKLTFGGLPVGITEIFDEESALGKTSMALEFSKQAISTLFFSVEQKIPSFVLQLRGIDPNKLFFCRCGKSEEILEILNELPELGLVILDSLASTLPTNENESSRKFLRGVSEFSTSSQTPIIILNQGRRHPFSTSKSFSGIDIQHWSKVRIILRSAGIIQGPTRPIGHRLDVYSYTPEHPLQTRQGLLDMYFEKGFSEYLDTIRVGLETGTLERRGSSIFYNNRNIGISTEKAVSFLKKDVSVYKSVKESCIDLMQFER